MDRRPLVPGHLSSRLPQALLALALVAAPAAKAQYAANAASAPSSGSEPAPRAVDAFSDRLNALLHGKVRSGTWGAMVVSLTNGDTLFASNAGTSLNPASTMKLYTTALAFENLGPDHQFSTDVLVAGAVDANGTLDGDLILRGGGDPALSRRFFKGDGNAPMRALARLVADAGIKRVRGDIIGDDGAFEAKAHPDGWLQRYLHASYAAPVSALSLNENIVHVVVTPGRAGAGSQVRLEPATTTITIANAASTRAGSRNASLSVSGADGGTIRVRGWIGATSQPRVYVVVVPEPARFATGAFARALSDAGVTVEGSARIGSTPDDAVEVTSLKSPPLSTLAEVMNGESINHLAELIFRNVARRANPTGVGTATMGNALLRDFMMLRVGASPQEVFAADGSGLSTLDRVTARSLVKLLSYAHNAPWSREFHESLPIAGREETLRTRMRATPAQGNLHAKTGTTSEVVALSGYVSGKGGEMLAFALVYNGRDRWNARATIDAMGAAMAGFERE